VLNETAPSVGLADVATPAKETRAGGNADEELAIITVTTTRTVSCYTSSVQRSDEVSNTAVNLHSGHPTAFAQYYGGTLFASSAHFEYSRREVILWLSHSRSLTNCGDVLVAGVSAREPDAVMSVAATRD